MGGPVSVVGHVSKSDCIELLSRLALYVVLYVIDESWELDVVVVAV